MTSAGDRRARRLVIVGVILSLVVSVGLLVRLFAIDNLEAAFIVAPAIAGALIALLSARTAVVVAAVLLTTGTSLVSLFGGVGLLYVPSIVLFAVGAWRSR